MKAQTQRTSVLHPNIKNLLQFPTMLEYHSVGGAERDYQDYVGRKIRTEDCIPRHVIFLHKHSKLITQKNGIKTCVFYHRCNIGKQPTWERIDYMPRSLCGIAAVWVVPVETSERYPRNFNSKLSATVHQEKNYFLAVKEGPTRNLGKHSFTGRMHDFFVQKWGDQITKIWWSCQIFRLETSTLIANESEHWRRTKQCTFFSLQKSGKYKHHVYRIEERQSKRKQRPLTDWGQYIAGETPAPGPLGGGKWWDTEPFGCPNKTCDDKLFGFLLGGGQKCSNQCIG